MKNSMQGTRNVQKLRTTVILQGPDQAMVMLSALESTSVGAAGVAGGGEHRYCSVSSEASSAKRKDLRSREKLKA